MQGKALVDLLIDASGLPPDSLRRELERVLRDQGLDSAEITLEAVREVMAIYLRETLLEAKQAL